MIITVARECGSNGHEIAELLAQKTGSVCYDKERLMQEAKRQNTYEKMRSFFEEQPIDSLLYAIAVNSGIYKVWQDAFTFIQKLAAEQSIVLIGRCGNYVLKDYEDVTSVYVHACLEDKIKRVMQVKGMTAKKAEEYIRQVEEKRRNFHKTCTGQNWGEAKNYDLCINGSSISSEDAAQMILNYRDCKRKGND